MVTVQSQSRKHTVFSRCVALAKWMYMENHSRMQASVVIFHKHPLGSEQLQVMNYND